MQLPIIIFCILPFLGFVILFAVGYYLEYVLEDLRLDNNPFNENVNIFYPGKKRKIARYYIDKNVEGKKRIQNFIYMENIAYALILTFFLIPLIAIILIAIIFHPGIK